MASIVHPDKDGIARAAALLTKGECIGMPTETVYGLAANAYDEQAVLNTFSIKARPLFDPLIVHVCAAYGSLDTLHRERVIDINRMALAERQTVTKLMDNFWPGPLTLVLPRGKAIGDFVTSGLQTVAVRMPFHPIALALLKELPFPLSAPSANRFGRVSPTSAQDVVDEFGDSLELVLEGGRCQMGVESTVVQVTPTGTALILRPGSLAKEQIEKCLGTAVNFLEKGQSVLIGASPGLMENHYAPAIPLLFLQAQETANFMKEMRSAGQVELPVALVWSSGKAKRSGFDLSQWPVRQVQEFVLSPGGDSFEAARNLFHTLREAERCGAKLILCDRLGLKLGLWIAIDDRLQKASFKGGVDELLLRLTQVQKTAP